MILELKISELHIEFHNESRGTLFEIEKKKMSRIQKSMCVMDIKNVNDLTKRMAACLEFLTHYHKDDDFHD